MSALSVASTHYILSTCRLAEYAGRLHSELPLQQQQLMDGARQRQKWIDTPRQKRSKASTPTHC
jgi:hypothetical protein